jgi:crossover junction endodeoxyribonuclease RuvC
MSVASDRLAQSAGLRQKILGIDPGTAVTGWGIVEAVGSTLVHVAHGTIATAAAREQGARLRLIYAGIQEVLARHQPDGFSLEKVFFAHNAQSALKLGQARGVALLAAAESRLEVHEYSSNEIKSAVVGYGHATKEQVQKMVGSLLRLSEKISADAADALAAAICHLHRNEWQTKILRSMANSAPRLARR